MDPARREELLKMFPAPWAAQYSAGGMLTPCMSLGPAREIGAIELVALGRQRLADEVAIDEVAILLVEAWNGHFDNEMGDLVSAASELAALADLARELPTPGRLVRSIDRVRAWKRDSEELAAFRKSPSSGPWATLFSPEEAAQLFRMRPPREGEITGFVASLIARVRGLHADSEELAEIRKEMDQTVSPQIQQAFDDLARQDCQRGAQRLARVFDWTPTEAKLAGEILFMELWNREEPEIPEWEHACDAVQNMVKLRVHRCSHCGLKSTAL
jgi:hypothetical protein